MVFLGYFNTCICRDAMDKAWSRTWVCCCWCVDGNRQKGRLLRRLPSFAFDQRTTPHRSPTIICTIDGACADWWIVHLRDSTWLHSWRASRLTPKSPRCSKRPILGGVFCFQMWPLTSSMEVKILSLLRSFICIQRPKFHETWTRSQPRGNFQSRPEALNYIGHGLNLMIH